MINACCLDLLLWGNLSHGNKWLICFRAGLVLSPGLRPQGPSATRSYFIYTFRLFPLPAGPTGGIWNHLDRILIFLKKYLFYFPFLFFYYYCC